MSPEDAHKDSGQPRSTDRSRRICIGKITAPHGVKGLVKIRPFGDDTSLLEGALFTSETGADTLSITLKNPLGKYILASIEGVQDRNQSETLKGTDLYIARDALPEIEEEGSYYYEDLLGMNVEDEAGQNLGTVITADNFGASDIIEVQGPKGEFMLPFIDDYIVKVDDKIIIKDYEQFIL